MSEPADFDSWQALSAGKWQLMERAATMALKDHRPLKAAVAFGNALSAIYPLAPFEKRRAPLTFTERRRLGRFAIIAAHTARHFEERNDR